MENFSSQTSQTTNRVVLLIHAYSSISSYQNSFPLRIHENHIQTRTKMYNILILILLLVLRPILLFRFFLANLCFSRRRRYRPLLLPLSLSSPLRRRWQQQQRPVHLHPQLASPFRASALREASRPRAVVPFRLLPLLLLLLNFQRRFLPLHLVSLVVAEKTAAAVTELEEQIRR